MASVHLNSLNDIIGYVHSGPSLNNLVTNLRAFARRDVGETILASIGPDGSDPLGILDPSVNTVGALFILSSRLNVQAPGVPWDYIEAFCAAFDPVAARHAPERVGALARGIAYYAEVSKNTRLAISPLRMLIMRYSSTPGTLTAIHCVFLRMCIRADCWTHALPILGVPLVEIDRAPDISYLDNLTYFYLGGIIYAVLHRYQEAEEFFETTVTAPGQALSAVQYEAAKKLSLVQLILYGKVKPWPKYANTAFGRMVKQSSYGSLSKNYPSSTAALQSVLEKDATAFATDGNIGLIKQVIHHAPRWIVRKLTNTYLTLSMEEISKATANDVKTASSPEAIENATRLILGMIERNEIYATITPAQSGDPAAASVTFRDPPPPKYFDPALLENILEDAQMMASQLVAADRELGRNKTYLSKAVKEREAGHNYDDMEAGVELPRIGGLNDWE